MARRLHRRDVRVVGCDDTTVICDDFTIGEIATLERVAMAISAAGGGCRPTMDVREHVHDSVDGARCDGCQDGDL